MDASALIRQRWSLWLRSERAFGVHSVPLPRSEAADDVQAVLEPPAPAEPGVLPASISTVTSRSAVTPVPERAPTDLPLLDPPLSRQQKIERLAAMNDQEVRGCPKCRLCQTRTQTVFGEGDPDAPIFFIGEGPGENEDLQGRPFVGRAGELLNKMIAGMTLRREQVFIANIVKCRPPNNRVPAPDEVEACAPYLVRQLEIVRPKVIVTLGLPAAKYMLSTKLSMGKLRGTWQSWRGIKLMPTFHPAYLLRSYTDENRAMVWSDLKQVMAEIGISAAEKNSRASAPST